MKSAKFLKALVLSSFLLLTSTHVVAATSSDAGDFNAGDSLKMSNFHMYEQYDRADLLVGTEFMSLKTSGGELKGFGARLGVDYSVNSSWSINPNLALVYDSQSQGYMYSGISGLVRYNWKHNNMMPKKDLSYDGRSIYSQSNSRTSKIITLAGIEQLFLNGAANVYPAAGMTAGVAYIDSFFGTWTEISLRGSMLTANNLPLTAMYLNISLMFGL